MRVSALLSIVALALSAPVAAAAADVNDAQIASIVVTANQVDIDAGKAAAAKTTNPEVEEVRAADGDRSQRRERLGDGARDEAEGDA